MVDAIGSSPFVSAQAATVRATPASGADFQSYLTGTSVTASGTILLGKPGSDVLANLPILHHSDEDTATLQGALAQAFNAAGIDTSKPIELGTGADGSVIVKGDNPQKAAIEKVFKDHPALRGLYTKVAVEDEFSALGRATSRYTSDYQTAVGNAAQTAVFDKYEPIFRKITQLGSDLTFAGGKLTSDALSYADSLFPQSGVG